MYFLKRSLLLLFYVMASLLGPNTLHSASGPQSSKKFKIYIVLWRDESPITKGFKDYLKNRGVEAEYIIRNCNQNKEQCSALIPEIKSLKPDLIYTWGTSVTEAIAGRIDDENKEKFIWDIPIVAAIVTDPIASKIIYSLEKPGRNVTGINHVATARAHLESMKSYKKETKKIAALFNPAESNSKIMVDRIIQESKNLQGIQINSYPITLGEDKRPLADSLPEIIRKIHEDGNDFVYMTADTFVSSKMDVISQETIKYGLPSFGSTESMFLGNDRPLMGLVSRFYNVGLALGQKAEQILVEGKTAEEIPYETLKKMSLMLDPSVFRKIQIYPPLEMLRYAEIIQDSDNKN